MSVSARLDGKDLNVKRVREKKDKKSPSIMQLLNVNICVKIASDTAWIMWVNRLLITRMFP